MIDNIDLSLTRNRAAKEVETPLLFSPNDFRNHFCDAVSALRKQFMTASLLLEMNKEDEAEDIWRSQIVFLASAFDFYMHELTHYGLTQIFSNAENWKETDSYKNITLPLSEFQKALSSGDDMRWFHNFVIQHYSGITMMDPDKVKEQMSLIGLEWKNIAKEVFYERSSTIPVEKKFSEFLKNLYKRRNEIAHQSDREFRNARHHSIKEETVKEYVDTISKIVAAIDKEIERKNTSEQ